MLFCLPFDFLGHQPPLLWMWASSGPQVSWDRLFLFLIYHIFHPNPLKYVPIRSNSFHPFQSNPIRFFIYFAPSTRSKERELCARNYRPSLPENKPKTLVFNDWKRVFWACFHENEVYKFRHWKGIRCKVLLGTKSSFMMKHSRISSHGRKPFPSQFPFNN